MPKRIESKPVEKINDGTGDYPQSPDAPLQRGHAAVHNLARAAGVHEVLPEPDERRRIGHGTHFDLEERMGQDTDRYSYVLIDRRRDGGDNVLPDGAEALSSHTPLGQLVAGKSEGEEWIYVTPKGDEIAAKIVRIYG